jgi:DNA mismatch repair protein MutS
MADGTNQASAPGESSVEQSRPFVSLLAAEPSETAVARERGDRSFAADLNIDQIVAKIAGVREEHEFIASLLYQHLDDIDTVDYRHEVFRDMEDRALFEQLHHFAEVMRQVRNHVAQTHTMHYQYQREGWFLDAASMYCDAVQGLIDGLRAVPRHSRALRAFQAFLASYAASAAFQSLVADTTARKHALAQIRYCTRIQGSRVDVSRYEGQADYSLEVLQTFARFEQGGVKDYRVNYRSWPGMNHVAAQIVQLVARLYPDEFAALDEYCRQHGHFFDDTIRQFERELSFYLAYLDYIEPLKAADVSFCYPEVTAGSKAIFATDAVDLALAKKRIADGKAIVRNDFHMDGPERVFVVSGPNQGGKTTFARMFGQLHHLASVGCPVPATAARLFLFDRLFVHFERKEDLSNMRGKLEDDLVRIRQILQAATPQSIVIMNEIFTSTTLSDARFLGEKVMEKIIELDVLCVYVTFVDELASLGPSVVSMVSTVVPENPVERTYKVVRGPADGLAYALSIAQKHDVTYERLRNRITV